MPFLFHPSTLHRVVESWMKHPPPVIPSPPGQELLQSMFGGFSMLPESPPTLPPPTSTIGSHRLQECLEGKRVDPNPPSMEALRVVSTDQSLAGLGPFSWLSSTRSYAGLRKVVARKPTIFEDASSGYLELPIWTDETGLHHIDGCIFLAC